AVTHHPRTPLARLLPALAELEQTVAPYNAPAVHDCIQVLRKNILREARLVSDLLYRLELPAPEPEPLPLSKKYPRPRRVLLVEDHADTLSTFARILRHKVFEVRVASSVSEYFRSSQPVD